MTTTATEPQKRKVGILLGVGIVLCPVIFSWFTLRGGHSGFSRGLSMGWLVLFVLSAMSGGAKDKTQGPVATVATATTPAPAVAAPVAAAAIAVDAANLWRAYDSNEVAADEEFKGKRLVVSGTVVSIDKDFADDIVVNLRSPNDFQNAHATVNDSEKSAAAKLRKGQKVKILCTGAGRVMGSPILNDCTIQ